MEEIEKIYAAYLLGVFPEERIIDWAVSIYSGNSETQYSSLLFNIASLSKRTDEIFQAGPYLKALIDGFYPNFYQNQEKLTIELLKQKCEQVLDNTIRPYDLCKLITSIEQEFDFPKWLGELYSVCDWCEPDTKVDEHLLSEVKERIVHLEKLLIEKQKNHT